MGLEIAATALFLSSTGVPQYLEQKRANKKSERAQNEANAVSSASAQVVNARRRRQAIAQARIAQAQNLSMQSEQVQTSSALSGVQAGLSTQLGANIGNQLRQVGNQQRIFDLRQQSANAIREGQERIAGWNAVAQTGQTIMRGFAGGASFGGTAGGAQPNAFASQTPGPRGAGGFR